MRYAIGDIHGCLETFLQLLKEIKFTKNDTLYILGDLIDRGPKSKQVIDTVLKMMQDGYDVHVLYGNHEDLMVRAATKNKKEEELWFLNGGYATLRSYGQENNIFWKDAISEEHWNFIINLPTKIVLDDYVLVHGGLDFLSENPIEDTDDYTLTWCRSIDETYYNKKKIDGKTVISGHNICSYDEIINMAERFATQVVIDNGCFMAKTRTFGSENYGKLCCFCLDSRTLHFTPCIDFN